MPQAPHGRPRAGLSLLALLALLLTLLTSPAGAAPPQAPASATAFKVIAFYNGTWDAAHISFVKEANEWFPRAGAEHGFTYTSTNNWNLLTDSAALTQYQVVLFLDDAPQSAAQRSGFEAYMRGGGAWMGFHVAAFTTSAQNWPWYHNQFLGSGNFATNTWGPTTATLHTDHRTHPSTGHLPGTFTSSVSEWYSWSRNLRTNPDIDMLVSVDPVSFPLGTDPNQSWYSGDYPIVWTNKNYRMLYANFGHNAMNYATNTPLSSTFASATQNTFLLDGLTWLGTGSTGNPGPDDPIPPTAWYSLTNAANGRCADTRAAATANGTVVQQYACNGTTAQQFRFQPTDGGFTRIAARNDPAKAVDVTGVSTADNAPLQLWTYSGGANQQWKPVREASGRYHFTARHSGKCLSLPAGGGAPSTALVQRTCDGSTAQSFALAG
ncbi:ThuA domain-containing protein [Streptomyces cyaneofuscatus]|uniref:ThuA domain-containing protein n=1 Tax=Streptomyces cyaneofuscatus TaxID=66883 RepID=UPI0034188C80